MNTYTFLISSFIIILMPGTGVLYTISVGIAKGKKGGMLAAAGCTAGIVPHLCISIVLSALFLNINANVFMVVKVLGALYLLYLGVGMIVSNNKLEFEKEQSENHFTAIICRGILLNLLNPKLTVFFFSFLPQYVSLNSENYVIKSLLYGLLFMIVTLIVFCGYGVLAEMAKKLLVGCPRRMHLLQVCFGIIFIIFAVQLVVTTKV